MAEPGLPREEWWRRLPPGQRDEWAEAYWDLGYDWCRPCAEWHRPPECPINEHGQPVSWWERPDE